MPSRNQRRDAFTIKAGQLASVLKTEVKISEPYHPGSGDPIPELFVFRAVWDTGATRSVITQKVIDKLGISKINEVDNYTANGKRKAGEYLVNICLPNNVVFFAVRVVDGDIYDTDALIGMDIIGQGDLSITNKSGKTWMTFQIPSSHRIDFVDEINIKKGKRGYRRTKKNRK